MVKPYLKLLYIYQLKVKARYLYEMNPFYSEIEPAVKKELDARKARISVYDRAEQLKNVYGRTAFAVLENPAKKVVIKFPEGGFEQIYNNKLYKPQPILTGVKITNEGRYGSIRKASVSFRVFTKAQMEIYEDAFLIPNHDNRIILTFGWNYAENTINKVSTFDGNTINLNPNKEVLVGYVFNFDWSVQEDGSFECTTHLVGEGYFAKGLDPKMPVEYELQNDIIVGKIRLEGKKVSPTIKEVVIDHLTTFLNLNTESQEELQNEDYDKAIINGAGYHGNSKIWKCYGPYCNGNDTTGNPLSGGIMCSYRIRRDLAGEDDSSVKETSDLQVYVNLYYIINNLINDLILRWKNIPAIPKELYNPFDILTGATQIESILTQRPVNAFRNARYVVGNTIKTGDPYISFGYYDERIFSPNLAEVIFPDSKNMADYSNGSGNENLNYAWLFPGKFVYDKYVDLGMTLINVEVLLKIINDAQTDPDELEDSPLNKFLNKIFDYIYNNSGEIYKLTPIMFEDTIQIVDTNFTADPKKNTEPVPYIFSSFHEDSITRNVNLSSQLPDKMATAMYIGNTAKISGIDPLSISVLNKKPIPKNTDNSPDTPHDTIKGNPTTTDGAKSIILGLGYTTEDLTNSRTEDVFATTYTNNKTGDSFTVGVNQSQNIFQEQLERLLKSGKINIDPKDISLIKELIGLYGPLDTLISLARSGLNTYKNSTAGLDKWNDKTIYPLNLSVTIDGISGLRFGNLITTDWLPSRYKPSVTNGPTIVFVVTKVEHTLKNQDWETILSTQCRLSIT